MHKLDCNSQSKSFDIDFSFHFIKAHNFSMFQTYIVNRKVTRARVAGGNFGGNETLTYVYGLK